MTYNSQSLLLDLKSDVRELILQASLLEQMPPEMLEQQPAAGEWSVAQVLEHLNIYGRYYSAAIEQQLHLHSGQPQVLFSPGWLGNYFTRLMQPQPEGRLRKMKAPKNARPAEQPDGRAMLQEFIAQQHQLLLLLQIARSADIGRIRIPTSLHPMIRLKLGDTFRFVIAHEQRHFDQIRRTLSRLGNGIQQAA